MGATSPQDGGWRSTRDDPRCSTILVGSPAGRVLRVVAWPDPETRAASLCVMAFQITAADTIRMRTTLTGHAAVNASWTTPGYARTSLEVRARPATGDHESAIVAPFLPAPA